MIDLDAIEQRARATGPDGIAWVRPRAASEMLELVAEVRRIRAAMLYLIANVGGHDHWDNTMMHGAGCERCIAQSAAKERARAALGKESGHDGEMWWRVALANLGSCLAAAGALCDAFGQGWSAGFTDALRHDDDVWRPGCGRAAS